MSDFFLIDIDGCITDGKNKNVDLKVLSELDKLFRINEVDYSFCTGRSATYVEALSQFLSFDGWSICENGSYIYNSKSDEVIINEFLSDDFLVKLNDLKSEFSSSLHRDDYKIELGKEFSISINPLKDSTENFCKKIKVMVKSISDDFVVDYSTTAVDVTAKNVNKKSGFFELKKQRIIKDNSYVVGIGDSSGDIPFLEECDYTACPSNAITKIKSLVDYVSPDKSTNGVIDIISRLSRS